MSKYGLHGKLQSKTGSSGKLTQILLEASKLVSTAKGCRLYLISKDKINNDSIWVINPGREGSRLIKSAV